MVNHTAAVTWQLFRSNLTRPLYIALWVPNGLIVGCESLFVPYGHAGSAGHGAVAGWLFAATAAGMMAGDLLIGRFVPPRWRDLFIGPLRLLLAVPYLFQHMFPSWFTGIAFAGIIIGALVPAAIMSIAAANLFTKNIFAEFFKPDASPELQTKMSRWTSLVVKLGALLFAVELPHTFSINLQLLGGVWILQLAPMLIGGLFTRWFHRWALLTGWLAGMVFGTLAAYNVSSATASQTVAARARAPVHSAMPSRITTWVATSAGRSPRAGMTSASMAGSMLE